MQSCTICSDRKGEGFEGLESVLTKHVSEGVIGDRPFPRSTSSLPSRLPAVTGMHIPDPLAEHSIQQAKLMYMKFTIPPWPIK